MDPTVIKFEISAGTVAWYGAIVATISVIASIILGSVTLLRDRTKVKIKVSEGFLVYGRKLSDKSQIFIEAINIGRRTVTLEGAGFTLKNGKHMVILEPLNIRFPHELKEGRSCQIFTDQEELLGDIKKEKSEVVYAWYRDATSKIYKTKFKLKEK